MDDLFSRAIIVDPLATALRWDDDEWAAVERSGYTAIQTTLTHASWDAALDDLSAWALRFEYESRRYLHVTTTDHIRQAKREGRLGVILGFQDTGVIGDDLGKLERLYAYGTRCLQLTYNTRNRTGDGCTEHHDAGLTRFGAAVIERMSDLGILLDLSHCGLRTSAEAIGFAKRPPAFTHTMCAALYDHPRAKPDALLRQVAERGGVTGIAALGYFLGPAIGRETTVETYIDHIDHAVRVAGIDHVGLSTDFEIRGIRAWATREQWYEPRLTRFAPSYRVQWPPWIPELDEPERFQTTARILARRGYSEDAIEKLLGANWMRWCGEVLG